MADETVLIELDDLLAEHSQGLRCALRATQPADDAPRTPARIELARALVVVDNLRNRLRGTLPADESPP